jgi:hypothetical protein
MTSTFAPSPLSGIRQKSESDHNLVGVVGALAAICELESKLRQAIQHTHPISTSLDWDFETSDRERKALLSIRYDELILTVTRHIFLLLCILFGNLLVKYFSRSSSVDL